MTDTGEVPASGYFGRGHHRVGFLELGETFLGRLILQKLLNSASAAGGLSRTSFSLIDLFPAFKSLEALEEHLSDVEFVVSAKVEETLLDFFKAQFPFEFEPDLPRKSAIEFYNGHLASRIHYLYKGDEYEELRPFISAYEITTPSRLHVFQIDADPKNAAECVAASIRNHLELPQKLVQTMVEKGISFPFVRVDYRRQIDFLTAYIDRRQAFTGESQILVHLEEVGFRHLINMPHEFPGFSHPVPATTTVEDKILLPLFLETNGLVDVLSMSIASDPSSIKDISLQYLIQRPSQQNIYELEIQGLSSEARKQLSEHEVKVFDRVVTQLNEGFVFGGKPLLQKSFATLAHFLVRRLTFSLEEPSYLKLPALRWLQDHVGPRILMEDEFFLPFLYEKLREQFGSRVVKKPDRFGGEIDILFDDQIPIELKVRRGRKGTLTDADIDEKFKPAGQAAAYATISRLGVVIVLDLPAHAEELTNLEQCCTVVQRDFDVCTDLPTCIVCFIFHCHHPLPSGQG